MITARVLQVDYRSLSTGLTQHLLVTAASLGVLDVCALSNGMCKTAMLSLNGVTVPVALPGDTIQVTLTDLDLDSDVGTPSVAAHVDPDPGADYELLNLTFVSPGVYRGRLYTAPYALPSVAGDGVLEVPPDSQVRLTYMDTAPVAAVKATVHMAVVGVLSATLAAPNAVPSLLVTLADGDLNANSESAESIVVYASTPRYALSGALPIGLTETGPGTGVFQGALALRYGPAAAGRADDALWGLTGDRITVTYADVAPAGLRSLSLPLTFPATLDAPSPYLTANAPFTVAVRDGDLDQNPLSPDVAPAALQVIKLDNGVSLLFADLAETGDSTGVFTARLLSNATADWPTGLVVGLDVLRFVASLGDRISFEYRDASQAGLTVQRIGQQQLLGRLSVSLTVRSALAPPGTMRAHTRTHTHEAR